MPGSWCVGAGSSAKPRDMAAKTEEEVGSVSCAKLDCL